MGYSEIDSKLLCAINAAIKAGQAILDVYNTNFAVENKEDNSPLTQADKASHKVIEQELAQFDIPLLSEEGKHLSYAERKHWNLVWIVDPLDGTKEFIKRNGEFTVNIALVENEYPIMGIIYIPVKKALYFAQASKGAHYVMVHENQTAQELVKSATPLHATTKPNLCRIVASRSHMSDETQAFIEQKRKEYAQVELVSQGSSLKFCLIAAGEADCYPRYAPTMEWDTAAGQILVEEVGKQLTDFETGQRMRYNRENLRNNWFLVA